MSVETTADNPLGLIFCHEHQRYCGARPGYPESWYAPENYRKCRACGAPTGTPCSSLSGRIASGLPDGIRTPLPRPHVARQRRAGR